jgi:hypothetical protein
MAPGFVLFIMFAIVIGLAVVSKRVFVKYGR